MTEHIYKTHSKLINGKYFNVYNEWESTFFNSAPGFTKMLFRMKMKSNSKIDYSKLLPVFKPFFVNSSSSVNSTNENIRATWLGHASVYVDIEGFKVLFDPVFSDSVTIVGPTRYRPCPVETADIVELDAVAISHNHYDHMDTTTLIDLANRFPDLQFFVPNGDKANMDGIVLKGAGKIHEMDWWQEETLTKADRQLKLVFTPTQHWSKRGIFDSFKSLWGSYALIGSEARFWFAGDTGYCRAFEEIGRAYGPFDCAAIPIGAYEPRKLMKYQHVNPEEALQIHRDIGSRLSFGIHWGTFVLTEEDNLAPREIIEDLVNEAKAIQTKSEDQNTESLWNFVTINHGETLLTNDGKEHRVIRGAFHSAN